MFNRRWLLVMLLGGLFAGRRAAADEPIAPYGPDLKTTLDKGLKLRRPVEFQFAQLCVDKVDAGVLPRSLVESTFLYARYKQPWPFPYFQRAMRERAKKIGVTL